VRRFASFARRDDLVLDVGCGPANDLRVLRDAGLHPVGIDLSSGALTEARVLLPSHPLVFADFEDPPFLDRSFGGLWMSGAFAHLPRERWRDVARTPAPARRVRPVYFTCHRGRADLEPFNDPLLGEVHVSAATGGRGRGVAALARGHRLSVDVRPDLRMDRRVPWVVALGRIKG
jgi:SAM-dependent methyltransferase